MKKVKNKEITNNLQKLLHLVEMIELNRWFAHRKKWKQQKTEEDSLITTLFDKWGWD